MVVESVSLELSSELSLGFFIAMIIFILSATGEPKLLFHLSLDLRLHVGLATSAMGKVQKSYDFGIYSGFSCC